MTILKRTSIVLAAAAVAASAAAGIALARDSDPSLVITAAAIAGLAVAGGFGALFYALLERRRQRMAANIGRNLSRMLGQEEPGRVVAAYGVTHRASTNDNDSRVAA